MIKLEEIYKSIDGNAILKNVSVTVDDSTTVVLIGESGSGKSTLLRLAAGILFPDSGNILIESESLHSANLNTQRRKFGYVIQEGGLFPHLTAFENISLVARIDNWTREELNGRSEELCELTKFPMDLLNRYPTELSGGQVQRVSLMRALFLDPPILLMDEPLGALDPLIRFDLQNDLKDIFGKLKKTVLLVTHDLNEAAFFADEIYLIREGEIVQSDKPDRFFRNPVNEYVEKFIQAQRSSFNRT